MLVSYPYGRLYCPACPQPKQFNYHEEQGRGFLRAGLIEEIRALTHPPIPWDVELARGFDNWFQPLERGHSSGRAVGSQPRRTFRVRVGS